MLEGAMENLLRLQPDVVDGAALDGHAAVLDGAGAVIVAAGNRDRNRSEHVCSFVWSYRDTKSRCKLALVLMAALALDLEIGQEEDERVDAERQDLALVELGKGRLLVGLEAGR